jgi:DNA-binding LacI/PurR family transcriptional regulator
LKSATESGHTRSVPSAPSRPSPNGRRLTIGDVATLAGVSSGTVSRVLNGKRWVSDEARHAVEEAIRATGYRPNAQARGLKLRRTGIIAVVLGEKIDRLFGDPNFAVLLRGISQSLSDRGLSMVLLLAGEENDRERAFDLTSSGQVDGAIFVSWYDEQATVEALERVGVPVVFCGDPAAAPLGTSIVCSDDLTASMRIVQHLQSRGRSRIAMIAHSTPERIDGYRRALGDEADDAIIEYGDYSRESGYAAMKRLLASDAGIDAVFAANDLMAAGALDALREAGLRVPQDIAVAGFDDSDIATKVEPHLTTMRQAFDRISAELTRVLCEQIEGNPGAQVRVATELVIREST